MMHANRLFLATLKDRHGDDCHRLFSHLGDAQIWCVNQMKCYGRGYIWREPEWDVAPHWLWYRETIDDGPTVRIADIQLDAKEDD